MIVAINPWRPGPSRARGPYVDRGRHCYIFNRYVVLSKTGQVRQRLAPRNRIPATLHYQVQIARLQSQLSMLGLRIPTHKNTSRYITTQRQMTDVAQNSISKMMFLSKFCQVELGFSCLTRRAFSLWRPKKIRLHPVVSQKVF